MTDTSNKPQSSKGQNPAYARTLNTKYKLTPEELSKAESCYPFETGVIYSIRCRDRQYVGQTSGHWASFRNGMERIANHRRMLDKGIHPARLMQQDWDQTPEDFTVEILEILPLPRSNVAKGSRRLNHKKELFEQEKFWQAKLNALYSKKGEA